MGCAKYLFFLGMAVSAMAGCATAEDPGANSLARQQRATLESLQNEIQRLNQELDETVSHREGLQTAAPKFEKIFSGPIAQGDIRVDRDPRGLVITVRGRALFDPDETQLTPAGEEILGKIASVLSRDLSGYRVLIEGHTDNQPVEDAEGTTNWEYSIGRAVTILHYFVENQDLAPERFGVAGYAEYHPVDSNATEEGRDRNRRVEIVIAPQKVSDAPGR